MPTMGKALGGDTDALARRDRGDFDGFNLAGDAALRLRVAVTIGTPEPTSATACGDVRRYVNQMVEVLSHGTFALAIR